jgi:hypothetical protein
MPDESEAMRTRGAGAQIPAEYQGATSPFVGVHVVYRPNDHYHELIAYAHYLAKDGKGDGEDAGVHFTQDGQEPDIPAFLSRLWKAPWCFKVVLSPDPDISPTLPLQDVAQSWMQAIEQDLGVKLDWIGAVHHDTNTPHGQFLWSGRTLAGEPVRIDREYIGHGLRARAAEMVDLFA